MSEVSEDVQVGADGETFPLMEVLTGRGFITGKSGSGKSNTASVLAEALLDEGVPLLIVDTDGEYYGLKEEYEMLHVGGDARADVQLGAGRAETLAELALEENIPIILDVSGYVDQSDGEDLIEAVVSQLFAKENQRRKPFLLLVEELHEFVPEGSGLDDVGETLVRVAKRGRKRGLGLCGMSQRPAAVDKDFITQCDWLVWHRLTWENDTKVVERILGDDVGDEISTLEDGEAYVMTDWDERTRRFRFRRKRTFDAGATPDLEDVSEPSLKSVDSALIEHLQEDSVAAPDADAEPNGGLAQEEESVEPLDVDDGGEQEVFGTQPIEGTPLDGDAPSTSEGEAPADDGGPAGGHDEPVTGDGDASTGDSSTSDAAGSDATTSDGRNASVSSAGTGGTASGTGRNGRKRTPAPQRNNPVWEFGQLVWFVLVRLWEGALSVALTVGELLEWAALSLYARVAGWRATEPETAGDLEVGRDDRQ